MKPETIIQQGLKSANILLKNAQKRAAELDHLKGELVRCKRQDLQRVFQESRVYHLGQQDCRQIYSMSYSLM